MDNTKFAFEFEAYNKNETDDDGYRSRRESVDITVIATNFEDALGKAKLIVERANYQLGAVYEVLRNGERLAR